MHRLDIAYQRTQLVVLKRQILPALQHKRPKPELIPHATTRQNLVVRQSIPLNTPIARSNSAIITIISAIIRKFYQSALIHVAAIPLLPTPLRMRKKRLRHVAIGIYQPFQPLVVQVSRLIQGHYGIA